MMNDGRGALGGIVLLLTAVLLAAPAFAQDVWRLAGTFNGWNTNDAAWTMTAQGGAGTRHVLEREIDAGVHRFKFVKNGDWANGHFGQAAGGALEQPGGDITLRIAGKGVYQIVLDTRGATWTMRTVRVESTVFEPRVATPLVENRAMVVDLSGVLTMDKWGRGRVMFESDGQRLTDLKSLDREGRRVQMRVNGSGPLKMIARLDDGGKSHEKTFELAVLPDAMLRYVTSNEPNTPRTVPLEPQAGGVLRAIVPLVLRAEILGMEVNAGAGESVRVENASAPAGTYAVEVRDGAVVTQRDPSLPMMLIPGNWVSVRYVPTSTGVRSVHLVGDFNGWARPGTPGSIELVERADGSFSAIFQAPSGAHKYRFLLDDGSELLDPGAKEQAPGPGGAPASVLQVGAAVKEFPKARPGAIEQAAVQHDPASRLDFHPISRALGLADISLRCLPGDAERVALRLNSGAGGATKTTNLPMTRVRDLSGFDRWTARIMTGEPMALYSFTLHDGEAEFTTEGFSASIEPALEHPAWAMGAVWYQIFPDRFRNGNALNDPHGAGVFKPEWNSDWYTVSKEEESAWRTRYNVKLGEPMPEKRGGKFFNVVWDRRYGGDLQGIAEKLDYLRDLGVTALYMNPIFEAESMHKYDATDYRHIDDNFGAPASAGKVPETFEFKGEPADPKTWTWTPSDRYFVDQFLPQAKQRGIRVVLDGVWNHTGKPFFAFRDIMERGDKSPYKDWFYVTFNEKGELDTWVSWFNTGALPKFRQQTNGDLVPPVKEHIFNVTRRWMDPNGDGNPADGIDGWRLDVALDVGMPFWRDWRALVKGINPNAIIIAEIWDDATPYLQGDAFDTQMHYPFAKPIVDWLGVRPGMPSSELSARLLAAFDDAPQTNLIHQNLFGSHDTDRFVSMLQNPNRAYDDGNRPQDHNYPYKDVKPSEPIYQRSMLGVAIQALYCGSPMVYYGDEVGMWGADDPTDRKPFPWKDLGPMANKDEEARWDLHKQYTDLLNLRRDERLGPVLRFGATQHLDAGDPDVFAFTRSLNGLTIVAVINRQDRAFDASALVGERAASVPPESAKWWVKN